ncbi:MAG: hypothetical protein RSE32_14280 [Comamonas sp.]|uniref:hypothetical protein n=1 Tax=Comamonas sp. TaxID=34028 RepID=UPI002FC6A7A5
MIDKVYRAEDLIEESGEVGVWVREYKVLRETPCGYWVDAPGGRKPEKFVYKNCSRFAFPTILEALENYRFRKAREIEHGIFKARKAKAALETVKKIIDSGAEPEDYFGLLFKAPEGCPGISDVSVEVRA